MKALILAAGRGSRMGDLTVHHPKCLLKLAGRPLLEWQLAALKKSGINDIALATGYLSETLESYKLPKFPNQEWQTTNMVATLFGAREWLEGNETILSYADIVYPSTTVEALKKASGDIAIAYNTEWLDLWSSRFENPLEDAETFKIDKAGRITEIGNKPTTLQAVEGQYMGLIKLTADGWQSLYQLGKADFKKLDMTSLLKRAIQSGIPVQGIPVDGNWYEVDSETDFHLYENWIATKKSWLCP